MEFIRLDISDMSLHQEAAKQLIHFAKEQRIFLFEAPMGAGKTTFIKSLCEFLNVTDTMSSPTYSIVNEYYTNSNSKLYHFDLYRLKSSEELFEIGFKDYIESGTYAGSVYGICGDLHYQSDREVTPNRSPNFYA